MFTIDIPARKQGVKNALALTDIETELSELEARVAALEAANAPPDSGGDNQEQPPESGGENET